jgi:hypothetical protein
VHAAPKEPQLLAVAPGWQSPLASQHPSHEAALHSGTGTIGQLESKTTTIAEKKRMPLPLTHWGAQRCSDVTNLGSARFLLVMSHQGPSRSSLTP